MQKANLDIHQAITKSGLKYWQVAQKVGCVDSTFSRWLRNELSVEIKSRIFAAIQELKEGGQVG